MTLSSPTSSPSPCPPHVPTLTCSISVGICGRCSWCPSWTPSQGVYLTPYCWRLLTAPAAAAPNDDSHSLQVASWLRLTHPWGRGDPDNDWQIKGTNIHPSPDVGVNPGVFLMPRAPQGSFWTFPKLTLYGSSFPYLSQPLSPESPLSKHHIYLNPVSTLLLRNSNQDCVT